MTWVKVRSDVCWWPKWIRDEALICLMWSLVKSLGLVVRWQAERWRMFVPPFVGHYMIGMLIMICKGCFSHNICEAVFWSLGQWPQMLRNYVLMLQIPDSSGDYLHLAGRSLNWTAFWSLEPIATCPGFWRHSMPGTGRMGQAGTAITICTEVERMKPVRAWSCLSCWVEALSFLLVHPTDDWSNLTLNIVGFEALKAKDIKYHAKDRSEVQNVCEYNARKGFAVLKLHMKDWKTKTPIQTWTYIADYSRQKHTERWEWYTQEHHWFCGVPLGHWLWFVGYPSWGCPVLLGQAKCTASFFLQCPWLINKCANLLTHAHEICCFWHVGHQWF